MPFEARRQREMKTDQIEAVDLLKVLEREKADYESLLRTSVKKQEIILSNDIEGLAVITEDEEGLIQGIQQRERERFWLLNGLAVDLGIPIDELNLVRLAELVDHNLSDRFLAIGKELKTLLEELASLNRVNSKLILDSLTFATCILDVLTQQDREKSTYKEKGQKERRGSPLVVDRRA